MNDYIRRYQKEQKHRRWMQTFYGQRIFSLPWLYKFKLKAYKALFNMGSKLFIGDNVFINRAHRIGPGWGIIEFGNDIRLGSNVRIDYVGKVKIGNHVDISMGVHIFSHNHDAYEMTHKERCDAIPLETTVSDNVWIGANAIILAGVTIGEYSVVGAGAVVTKDVPSNVVVAGNPAKVIRTL